MCPQLPSWCAAGLGACVLVPPRPRLPRVCWAPCPALGCGFERGRHGIRVWVPPRPQLFEQARFRNRTPPRCSGKAERVSARGPGTRAGVPAGLLSPGGPRVLLSSESRSYHSPLPLLAGIVHRRVSSRRPCGPPAKEQVLGHLAAGLSLSFATCQPCGLSQVI